jgi:hypothetical protein
MAFHYRFDGGILPATTRLLRDCETHTFPNGLPKSVLNKDAEGKIDHGKK